MSGFRAVQLFNLKVPSNGAPIPALDDLDFPATFRVTMAAIDPTEGAQTEKVNGAPAFVGSTLRILRIPEDSDDEDDEDEDLANLLNGTSDDSEDDEDMDDEDDEEVNGGPSDPAKSPKAKRMAALREALLSEELTAKDKGKGRATDEDEEMDEDEEADDDQDEDGEDLDSTEEFVICTLDPSKSYQQPLDITVNEHETVFFSCQGTHDIYLTGNILIPEEDALGADDYDDEDDEYDLSPDEDEMLYEEDEEDVSDDLDDIEDPRITEVDSEDEEAAVPTPTKVKGDADKGKKRPLEDTSEISNPEQLKLSKSQEKKMRKKMKDNAGNAVDATKADKKVQFSEKLIQGPSGSSQPNGDVAKAKTEVKEVAAKTNGVKDAAKDGASDTKTPSDRVVQGVTISDRKIGTGPAAKKGDKISMRYIGKLEKDKKVFDSNKKGPPFSFKLGTGEVIKGWDIGVQGIRVGGERRITVPAHHGYGSKGVSGIPPNSTLVFDVKCLEIK